MTAHGANLESIRAYATMHDLDIIELAHPGGGVCVVIPAFGGRIVYVGFGGANRIFAAPDFDAPDMWQGNYGGLRSWLSPEGGPKGTYFSADFKDWKCPAGMDPGDFVISTQTPTTVSMDNAFSVVTNDGTQMHLSMGRDIAVGDRPASIGAAVRHMAIDFAHRLENCGEQTLDNVVDLWHLAQVNPGGVIVVPTQGRPEWRNYFQPIPEERYGETDDCLVVKINGSLRFKLGIPDRASTGRIAYIQPVENGQAIAIIKRFSVDPKAIHCDRPEGKFDENGDAVQLYNHFTGDENAFGEIECHSPAATLTPGAEQRYAIRFDILEGTQADVKQAAGVLLERNLDTLDICGA